MKIGQYVKYCNSIWLIINIHHNMLVLQNQSYPTWVTVTEIDCVEKIDE